MPDGRVTHAEKDGVHVLRYFGRVDYMSAPAIKHFTDRLISQPGVSGLVFDLCEAENLDSTNLGLLARVADSFARRGGARSVIVSTRDDINTVLTSMGFDRLFVIVRHDAHEDAAPNGAELGDGLPAEAELRQIMIDAHRMLVGMSENGRLQFEEVVKCLEHS
jgi:anti-anti-sigma factor